MTSQAITPDTLSRRTIVFVNIAHWLDHFLLLIYPTAVIAIAAERGLDYGVLIGLSTGTFVAFGLFALPMGWLSERFGRRNMMAAFFVGSALSCFAVATAASPAAFFVWLTVLGVFSAIYHPIGSAMLVSHARKLGRDLGWNGVWGNLGAASASGVTALIAATIGWRAAFVVPGLLCLAVGAAFLALVPGDGEPHAHNKAVGATIPVGRPFLVLGVFAVALVAGGMTFNLTTIALPKVLDERLGAALPLVAVGWLATAIFVFGALTQLLMGRLVDRFTLPAIFVAISALQPVGLVIAAAATGPMLVAGLVVAMAALYGQVVVNDAMVARYVPPAYRAKAYSIRYFLGFTTSGFAVPLIALMHGQGGFPAVMAVAAVFGLVIFLAACAVMAVARPPAEASVPAE